MKWILALHILSVIAWMAGLLYLPRIFVYHAETQNVETLQTFKTMERRLFYFIMTPALVLVLLTGHWLFVNYSTQHPDHMGWLYLKIFFVGWLLVFHVMCGYYLRKFQQNQNTRSGQFFRIFNEIPTILMIVIVLLVVLKP